MFLLNLACLFLLGLAASAQPNVGAVSGRVVGLGGHSVGPLPYATVTLIGVDGFRQPVSGEVAKTIADLDGKFRFERLFPGVYFLRAESPGYVSNRSQLVKVHPGETTIVDLCQRVGFEDRMELSGIVRGAQGALGDATVNISFLPLSEEVQQLRTDSNGRYGPVLVTPGDQVITVFKPGYEYESRLVKSGSKRIVDFRLRRSKD